MTQLAYISSRIWTYRALKELADAMTNSSKSMILFSNKLIPQKVKQYSKIIVREDFALDMISDIISNDMDIKHQYPMKKRKNIFIKKYSKKLELIQKIFSR